MLNIVGLLNNPTKESVGHLFCEASIYKALATASPEEIKTAKDRNDTEWLKARQVEYDCRRLALAQHIDSDFVSKETSEKIDVWAKENPYTRPVNQALIDQINLNLQQVKGRCMDAYAWRDRLHNSNRFGWDHAANIEDKEYSEMLAEMVSANTQKDRLIKDLALAESGFLQ